jgi:hypothetical protein
VSKSNGAWWWHHLQRPLFALAVAGIATATVAAGVALSASSSSTGTAAAAKQPSPSASPNNNGNGVGNGKGNDKKDLVVSGSVTGLYPGATRPLSLNVTNDNNFSVRLYQLTADVGRPVTTGTSTLKAFCRGTAVTIVLPTLPVTIPEGGGTLSATAQMDTASTNDCRNATFPITYTGKVDKP